MFKRILVPLDGSSFGEAALRPAVSMARTSRGELRLVSAHEPGWAASRGDVQSEARRLRAEYLTRVGRTFLDVPLSTVVREGAAEEQILKEAESWRADIVVMSTHGRGAVSRFWLGSVADHCLRNARVPLMLVRAWPSALGVAETIFAPRRIIVPLDGSEVAGCALESATELARVFGAALDLVRIVPGSDGTHPVSLNRPPMDDLELDIARARSYVHGVECCLRERGLVATSHVVADRHIAHAIIEQAAGDLVVMATRSRALAQQASLGSVTDKVVRGTRGPVLAIPVVSGLSDATGHDPPGPRGQASLAPKALARRVVG